MTLPVHPNAISLGSIRTEYALSGALSLSQLYQNSAGPVYPSATGYPGGSAVAIPSSGAISLASFHGNTAYTPIARNISISAAGAGSWTVPATVVGNLTIQSYGGGGGGCTWPGGAPGAGGGGGAKFIGTIAGGTVISYTVAAGGAGFAGDSSRYARDPGNTQFGVSGNPYYMYIPGLGVGGYNMAGSQRGPGVGSTAQGAAGIILGTGGNGGSENSGTGGNATTIGGGGGGAWSGGGNGSGADGGGAGGSPGTWPGGGGHGRDGGGFAGANGGIIITGVW
jgi:hypothetical protein